MNGHEIIQAVRTFEDLDTDTRVEHLLSRTPEQRDLLFAYLLLNTHDEVLKIKRDRRWLYGAGHAAAIFLGGIFGIFGQGLRP